jgi:hypothetical protein
MESTPAIAAVNAAGALVGDTYVVLIADPFWDHAAMVMDGLEGGRVDLILVGSIMAFLDVSVVGGSGVRGALSVADLAGQSRFMVGMGQSVLSEAMQIERLAVQYRTVINAASSRAGGAGRAADVNRAAARALSAEQAANLGRFVKKLPRGAGETTVRDLPGGGKVFQAEVPGRVPGSKAVYEKQVDAAGRTVQYTKTTYDPAGNIPHVKDKITGEVFP